DNHNIIRGDIRDRNDTILVSSKVNRNGVNRIYEYGRHFSHVIGYHSQKVGSTGIEAFFDKELSSANMVDIIKNKIDNKQIKGNTIKLTLDKNLQVYASEILANKKGSLVAINPKTGEILTMVSK